MMIPIKHFANALFVANPARDTKNYMLKRSNRDVNHWAMEKCELRHTKTAMTLLFWQPM